MSPTPHSLGIALRPDESFLGFVFRLAHRVGMPLGTTLADRIGLATPTNAPSDDALAALSEITGMEPETLRPLCHDPFEEGSVRFRGRVLRSDYLATVGKHRKACPRCLAEAAHHRAIWDLLFLSACPVHEVLLLEACPGCGEPLTWREADISRCRCGENLGTSATTPTDPESLRAIRAVLPLVGGEGSPEEVRRSLPAAFLRRFSSAAFVDLAYRIGLDISPGAVRRQPFRIYPPDLLDVPAHEAFQAGFDVILRAGGVRDLVRAVPELIGRRRAIEPAAIRGQWLGAFHRWFVALGEREGGGKGYEMERIVRDYRRTSKSGIKAWLNGSQIQ